MTPHPSLGVFTDGSAAKLDLPRLLETRMLVQANSGSGKSWAIRRLLEQTAGQVQQLVIDPEGEFATLRERFDLIIAAPHDGDALAHPRTAKLLAHRLLETGVSAILDIYDLKAHERQAFVRGFLDALVNAPKALWRPALVVLDEAHVYAPEHGKAESAGAVIDLATRGRKRGFSLIAATQRLAKLHKDVAAELLNKLVGRTGLDVDVKRAADELGMSAHEALKRLRPLEPGHFFAFGPALSATVQELTIGHVQTTHPKVGDRSLRAPPKPTAAIKAVLPKLADLAQEAEQEAQTVEELRRALAQARRDLTLAQKGHPAPFPAASPERLAQEFHRGRAAGINEALKAVSAQRKSLHAALHKAVSEALDGYQVKAEDFPNRTPAVAWSRSAPAAATATPAPRPAPVPRAGNGSSMTAGGKRRMLIALAQYPDGLTQKRLGLLTGLSPRSGTWSTYLGSLRSEGLIEGRDTLKITPAGLEALGHYEPLPSGEALIDYWRGRLGAGGKRAIFDAVVEAYPNSVSQEDVAERVNLSSRSGTWSTYLGHLRTLELIVGRGDLRANEDLFA